MHKGIYNLNRFVEAQAYAYPIALRELQEGQKRSHWMWYIFPQLHHLGHSYNAKYYGISGAEEAAEYLEHPILGTRIREVATTILNLPVCDARAIFGEIDTKKLCSSMTLFDAVAHNDIFSKVIDKFFEGRKDYRTLHLLNLPNY